MKRIFCPALCAALAFSASTTLLFAQSPSPQGSPDGQPPGHRGPPPSPLFKALDANHDGIISADEIANAPTVLKALAGPSGQLTRESLRPARREDDRQRDERRDGNRQGDRRREDDRQGDNRQDDNRRPRPDDSQGPGPQHENRRHQGPPPPPDGQDSPAANPDGQDGPPRPRHRPEDRRDGPRPDRDRDQQRPSPGASPNASPDANPAPGQDEPRHRPPHGDGLFDALDTNHDGVISADEITAAATSLKKADTNGDGQIDRQDHRPPPPQPRQND